MAQGSKAKGRKIGRNKIKCGAYRAAERTAKNAKLRQARHARRLARFAARRVTKVMGKPVTSPVRRSHG